jgi:hypothetical protein
MLNADQKSAGPRTSQIEETIRPCSRPSYLNAIRRNKKDPRTFHPTSRPLGDHSGSDLLPASILYPDGRHDQAQNHGKELDAGDGLHENTPLPMA